MKPNLIEYWTSRGVAEEESKIKTEIHLMNTERAFIIKYGKEEGSKLYRDKKIKEGKKSPRTVEYWIGKWFSLEDAKTKVSESQSTFSLNKCMEKYGKEKGIKVFTERQNKWINSLNKNGNIKYGYSKISQDLFWNIFSKLNNSVNVL